MVRSAVVCNYCACGRQQTTMNNVGRCILIQESLANAKVSARQPWYIGRSSLNRPPLRIAQQYQRNLYIVEKYFQCATIPSLTCGSIFIRLAAVASQTCQLAENSEKIWTYSSSRSSKVDDLGPNRKRICKFLLGLVINSNFGPILHRFWDTGTYWLKIVSFSYPSRIRRPRSLSSLWNFTGKLSARKLESWGYSVVKVAWSYNFNRLWLIHPCDGRTDGRAMAYSVL